MEPGLAFRLQDMLTIKVKHILYFLILTVLFCLFLPLDAIAISLNCEDTNNPAVQYSHENQNDISSTEILNHPIQAEESLIKAEESTAIPDPTKTQTESDVHIQSTFSYEDEPNNSKTAATILTVNAPMIGNINTSADNDWYVVSLPEDGCISIQLDYEIIDTTNGLWSCYIYQADGETLIDGSNNGYYFSGNNPGKLPAVGLAKGTYYIKITPYSSSQNSRKVYTLTVNYNAADNWERESNSTKSTSQSIPLNTAVNGSIYTRGDIDWFKFTLPDDGYIYVSFDHEYVDTNDRLWKFNLYQSDGYTTLDGSGWYWYANGNKLSDQPTVYIPDHIYMGLPAGTYYIKLEAYSSSQYSSKNYSLSINHNSANNWEKESNSTKATAESIPLNTPLHGSLITGGDIDWFKVIIDEESDLNISFMHNAIEASDSIGPLDYFWNIYFYKSDGSTSVTGYYYHIDGTSEVNTIRADNLSPGTYYVKIVPYSTSQYSTLHYLLEVGDGSNWQSNSPVKIAQTSFTQNNKITINGQGVGYVYFKLLDDNNMPIANRKIIYGFSGYRDAYTTSSDNNGEVVMQTPFMNASGSLTLNIQLISGITSKVDAITIDVIVNPLSFEEEWEATIGAGAGASVGIGVGGKIGVAEAEAKIADIGAKANAKPSMKIKNSYHNGTRSLEFTNTMSAEASVNAKAGLFANVNVAKTGVEISPAGIKGQASMGGYNSIGLKIDDYDPNNGDHIAKIGGYLFNNAVTANGANVMAVRLIIVL